MRSRDEWAKKLKDGAREHGFDEGYKPLYVPWDTIGKADTVFMSLNPGEPPQDADLEVVSDERGNSYEVEKETTKSPIAEQFLKLCNLLGKDPSDILTGVAAPYRGKSWSSHTSAQRKANLETGRQFWLEAFAANSPKLVIVCSDAALRMTASLRGARLERKLPSGWGDVSLRRYRSRDGGVIIQLPQLSRYKLLSGEPYVSRLKEILKAG